MEIKLNVSKNAIQYQKRSPDLISFESHNLGPTNQYQYYLQLAWLDENKVF